MTTIPSTHSIHHPTTTTLTTPQILRPDIIITTGIHELDRILGGFKTDTITYIDGTSPLILDLPNRLSVNTYRTFHTDTIYIDGGMHANPYNLARYARYMEIDQRDLLRHVYISRAFTAHQLTTMIYETLEPLIRTIQPQTLIAHLLPTLYLDTDITGHEAAELFTTTLNHLRTLTTTYHLITIITNHETFATPRYHTFTTPITTLSDEIVLFTNHTDGTTIHLIKKNKTTIIRPQQPHQPSLETFGVVI